MAYLDLLLCNVIHLVVIALTYFAIYFIFVFSLIIPIKKCRIPALLTRLKKYQILVIHLSP